MRLTANKDDFSAREIITRNGFEIVDETKPMLTAQVWMKNGREYRFDGWESEKGSDIMASKPKYITMIVN